MPSQGQDTLTNTGQRVIRRPAPTGGGTIFDQDAQPSLAGLARQAPQPDQPQLDQAPYVPDLDLIYGGVEPSMLPQEDLQGNPLAGTLPSAGTQLPVDVLRMLYSQRR